MSAQTFINKPHNNMKPLSRVVLDALPDSALWVEARGMLLSGRGFALDFQAEPYPTGAIFQEDLGLAVLIGKPESDLIFQVSELADELICPIENQEHISPELPGWSMETGSLMQLPSSVDLEDLSKTPLGNHNSESQQVRKLQPGELRNISDIPDLLLEELEQEVAAETEVFCSIEESKPVAFCFPASKSETLWDISIDTLLAYRRAGHAEKCVCYAIHEMAKRGLRPIWGVVDSNRASHKLATKLGFEEKYRIAVFTRER